MITMITTLIISNIVSWLAIMALGITVMALVRQVGLLHERISPAGALSIDKKTLLIGEAAPSFNLPSITGGRISLGGHYPHEKSTLLFFLSDTCPVCKTLLPIIKSIAKQESPWLRIVLASDGEVDEHSAFIVRDSLHNFPYLLSTELGMAYEIGKLPYGVLLDNDGKLISHGLVNTREHLESLLEAKRLGAATVQSYVEQHSA
jgi:methylamine dehydrogenase accessory protein MauD